MRALIAIAAVAAAGCVEEGPTFDDVGPFLARSCLACHAQAAAGRPSFSTLDDVRAHAQEMLFALETKQMPPGGIDRSGACNDFIGPAAPGDDDVTLFRAWIDRGMPAGSAGPASTPAESRRADHRVDVVLPATAGGDVHRCFLVDTGVEGALVGVGLTSAAPVHHAMLFTVPPGTRAPAPDGWDCPATPLVDGAALAFAWVPGQERVMFPDGAGVPLGSTVVVQIHTHGAVGDDVNLALFVDDQVARPVSIIPVAAAGFLLPAGDDDVELERSVPLPIDGDVDVIGVMPHLHQAGRAASLHVDGACVVDAPRFDFAFQEVAFFAEPLTVHRGARAALACRWDTSSSAAAVPFGESSDDEMCTVFLFATSGTAGRQP